MNNKSVFITLLIILLTAASTDCKPGCLSDTYRLKEKYDPKEYHDVVCYCPCDSWAMRGLSSDRKSECLQCGHAHNPGSNPYVPKPKQEAPNQLQAKTAQYISLEKFINTYKTNK